MQNVAGPGNICPELLKYVGEAIIANLHSLIRTASIKAAIAERNSNNFNINYYQSYWSPSASESNDFVLTKLIPFA